VPCDTFLSAADWFFTLITHTSLRPFGVASVWHLNQCEIMAPGRREAMKNFFAFVGTTVGSYVGYWLGSYGGFAIGCLASVVGMGLGLYASRRLWQAFNEEYL